MSGIDEAFINAQFIEAQIGPLPWDNTTTEPESTVIPSEDHAAVSGGIYANDSRLKVKSNTKIVDERGIISEGKIFDAGFDDDTQSKKIRFNSSKGEVCKLPPYEFQTIQDVSEKAYEPTFGKREAPINSLLGKTLCHTSEVETSKQKKIGRGVNDTLATRSESQTSDFSGRNIKMSATSLKISRSMIEETKKECLDTKVPGVNNDINTEEKPNGFVLLSRNNKGNYQKKEILKPDKNQDVNLQMQQTNFRYVSDTKKGSTKVTKKSDLSDESKEVDSGVDFHLDELLVLTQDVASAKWSGFKINSQVHQESTIKSKYHTGPIPADINTSDNGFNKTSDLQPGRGLCGTGDEYKRRKGRDSCDDVHYDKSRGGTSKRYRRKERSNGRDDRESETEYGETQSLRPTKVKIQKESKIMKNGTKKNDVKSDGYSRKSPAKCYNDMGDKHGEIKKKPTSKIGRRQLKKQSEIYSSDINDRSEAKIERKPNITRPIVDDDVYDISPVKNKEWLSASDSENKTWEADTNGHGAYEVSKKKSDTGTYIVSPGINHYYETGEDVQRENDFPNAERNVKPSNQKKSGRNANRDKVKKRTSRAKKRKIDSDTYNSESDYQQCITENHLKEAHKLASDEEIRQNKSVTDGPIRDKSKDRTIETTIEQKTGRTTTAKIEESDEDSELYYKAKRDEIHVELGDLMYDSDTDIGSAFRERSPSIQSRDLILPSPASNRTFVITESESDAVNADAEEENDRDITTPSGDRHNIQKKGRLERIFRWLFCCVKSNKDK